MFARSTGTCACSQGVSLLKRYSRALFIGSVCMLQARVLQHSWPICYNALRTCLAATWNCLQVYAQLTPLWVSTVEVTQNCASNPRSQWRGTATDGEYLLRLCCRWRSCWSSAAVVASAIKGICPLVRCPTDANWTADTSAGSSSSDGS